MCVSKNTHHDTFLTRKYPIFAEPKKGMVLWKNSNDELLKGILDGDCEVGLIGESTFHLYQRITHKNCKLIKVGESLKATRAGFATKMDSGIFCMSLISYVLDLHLLEMKDDGFFHDTWDRTLDQQGDNKCSSDKKPSFFEWEDDTLGDPLEIRDMWGIFNLHAMASLASLFLTPLCCNLFHKDRQEPLASYADREGQISIWRLDFSSPCRSLSPGRDSIWVTTVQHTWRVCVLNYNNSRVRILIYNKILRVLIFKTIQECTFWFTYVWIKLLPGTFINENQQLQKEESNPTLRNKECFRKNNNTFTTCMIL